MEKLKWFFVFCGLMCTVGHVRAETIKILDDEREALQARIELIRNARSEILISYYIFENDAVAHWFVAELVNAKRRGVTVYVFVDNTNYNLAHKYIYYMVYKGIAVREYNPFHLFRINKFIRYRLHDKIFLVDEEHLIVGGRNIENKYFGFNTKKNFRDRDVYINGGNAALHAHEYYFTAFASNAAVARYETPLLTLSYLAEIQEIEAYLAAIVEQFDTTLVSEASWLKGAFEGRNLHFVHDESRLKEKSLDDTAKQILKIIDQTDDTLLIDSPYVVLTSELTEHIGKAIKRGVYVRILTNSLAATDGLLPQAAYLNDRELLLKMGIDLYEYYGEECFHSKSMIADDVVMIGSMNMDERSFYLNKETYLLFYDDAVKVRLNASMNQSLEKAVKISANNKPISRPRHVGPIKWFFTNFMRFTIADRLRYLV